MRDHDFSYGHYFRSLKDARAQGYKFVRFGDLGRVALSQRLLLIRHDVDISLERSLKLARLEAKNNVQATYFLLFHSPFYSRMSEIFEAGREMIRLGHEVGYHYDRAKLAQYESIAAGLLTEIGFLEKGIGSRIHAFSEHNPLADARSIVLQNHINAYAVPEFKYVSDSVQNWREGCFCRHLGKHPKLQVLTHPEWWSRNGAKIGTIMRATEREALRGVRSEYRKARLLYTDYIRRVRMQS